MKIFFLSTATREKVLCNPRGDLSPQVAIKTVNDSVGLNRSSLSLVFNNAIFRFDFVSERLGASALQIAIKK